MRYRNKHFLISPDVFDYDEESPPSFEQWVQADEMLLPKINQFYASLEEAGEYIFSSSVASYKVKEGHIVVVTCYTEDLAKISVRDININVDDDMLAKWSGASLRDQQFDRFMKDALDGV